MKLIKYLIGILTVVLFFSLNTFGQQKEEMTSDQWKAAMDSLTTLKTNLQAEDSSLKADINNLNSQKSSMQSYDDCVNEMYSMVGATKADVDNFRRAVAELNGKISRQEGPKADRQKDLDALKANKISALPEFYDEVHNQMQSALDAWVEAPKEINYEVVKGDNLWNIAKKKQHYGNGFAWPVIYKANRDKIKDPNLIYPKQVFTIPPLTDEQKAKYEKIRSNYKPAPVQ